MKNTNTDRKHRGGVVVGGGCGRRRCRPSFESSPGALVTLEFCCRTPTEICSVPRRRTLQCVADCCRVVQCVVVCCTVLQCVAVCCSVLHFPCRRTLRCVAVCCSVLQCVAVCCSVLQCKDIFQLMSHTLAHVSCIVLQCERPASSHPVVCCSILQCVAACGSMWQCVAV